MQIKFPAIVGLGLLGTIGCHSFSPYGGGYGGGYGGAYAVPPGSYIPQGQVIVPGQVAPGQLPPGQMPPPSGWQASPRALTPTPNGPNDAPPFQSQPNQLPPNQFQQGSPSAPGSKLVPTPTNPLIEEDDDPLRGSGKPVGMNPGNSAQGARLGGITDDSEDNLAVYGEEAFKNPVPVYSASASQTINDPMQQTVQSRPNPYAFDSKGYSWLRGVVGMDPQDKSWYIEYNPDPSHQDTYSGKLTLVGSDSLETLLADDVVLLEGQVDPRQHDRYGKPVYRVQVVKRLIPKNT